MERGVGSIWCLVLLIPGLVPGCWSQGSPTVHIDGYTHNSTLTSGDSFPLGSQIILVCRVVGLPYGTPLSYTWTCPNGPCEVEGYYGRKVYNEHIMAVNTTSTRDGGTYTCQVTATGGQEATGSFTLRVNGGRVVHSYGRLIPHEFPITDLQQISGPDGIGRINCTASSGKAHFKDYFSGEGDEEVVKGEPGVTTTLVVKPSDSNVDNFHNRVLYCTDPAANYFYLFISSANPISVPRLDVVQSNSAVEFQAERTDMVTSRLIVGYTVSRFGIPMIGEYDNLGNRKTVTISPAVPAALYRITAWAVGDTRRSATPAVDNATTGEATPLDPRRVTIISLSEDGIELNWLPPTEPNGEVHYVIYYTPEGGTEQSIDTGSNLTHYNLTGLERNRVYTNIAVQAVNSAGRSGRSAAIARYNHTPPVSTSTGSPSLPGASSTTVPTSQVQQRSPGSTALIVGMVVSILVVVVLLSLVGGVVAVVVRASKKREIESGQQSHYKAEDKASEGDVSINMYQNVPSQATPASGSSKPNFAIAADIFVNPASATASFKTHMYDSTGILDQEPTEVGGGGVYEEARVEWDGGGHYENPVKGASGKQTKSAAKKINAKSVKLDDLYAQPSKVKKKKKNDAKEDSQVSRKEAAVPSDDLYAQPDMAKKKHQKSQQDVEQERKLPPQVPPPYKKHKEAKQEGEDEEDASALPPPYVPDTDNGDGSSPMERKFEYAVLDWHN